MKGYIVMWQNFLFVDCVTLLSGLLARPSPDDLIHPIRRICAHLFSSFWPGVSVPAGKVMVKLIRLGVPGKRAESME